ncbi:MAG: hypothetical protein KKB21_00380 [Nanoarchaeota archaeon]|nr:hypothetical protein [Nanoarchaeota archaeon]
MNDEIVEIYEKEGMNELIDKIRNLDFNGLGKSEHFLYSVDEKNTDIEMLRTNFKDFSKIKLIQKRKHRAGKSSYDFYYELEDRTYVIYSIAFEGKPILINGFHVRRNFEHFKKVLTRAYKDKLMGH